MEPRDILIATAVAGEMEAIQKRLDGVAAGRVGCEALSRGRLGKQAVRLVVTGPGMANAVHGLTAAVVSERPGLILQVGCGGGFREAGIDTGDLAVASAEIDVHLGIEPDGPNERVGELPFPVIAEPDREIFNRYPVDARESRRAEKQLKAAFAGSGVNVMAGPFITVATVSASADRSARLYRQYGALMENMEGAGTAHVAALYKIPFVEIRAVSNRVGDRDKRRWDLPLAFRNGARAVRAYLENREAAR